jgi:type II secretory pathway component GspD/PulD (secretin)
MIRLWALLAAVLLSGTVAAAAPADPRGARIFLNASVPLGSAVDAVGRQAHVNVTLHRDVSLGAPVELRLDGVTLDEAITAIASSQDLLAHREGSVITLGPCLPFLKLYNAWPSTYAFNDKLASEFSSALTMEPRRVYFTVRNGDVDELAARLKAELPPCSIVDPDRRLGRVVVAGSQPTIARAAQLLRFFDIEGGDIEKIDVVNLAASEIAGRIAKALPDGTLTPDDNSRAILVSGPPAIRDKARKLIGWTDVPAPEVWYDVWVVDYNPVQDTSNRGFLWGGRDLSGNVSPGATSSGFINRFLPVNVTINDLVQRTSSNVLATTQIRAKNGQAEKYNVVDVQSYGVADLRTGGVLRQDVSAGLKLQITPIVYNPTKVHTSLQLEYSDFVPSTGQFPSRTVRQLVVDSDLQDGETVVLSGLMRDVSSSTVSEIPWLSKLRIFGSFFRNKQSQSNRDEIVVLVTAHVINGAASGIPVPPAAQRIGRP